MEGGRVQVLEKEGGRREREEGGKGRGGGEGRGRGRKEGGREKREGKRHTCTSQGKGREEGGKKGLHMQLESQLQVNTQSFIITRVLVVYDPTLIIFTTLPQLTVKVAPSCRPRASLMS